jgi:hypothetical protein
MDLSYFDWFVHQGRKDGNFILTLEDINSWSVKPLCPTVSQWSVKLINHGRLSQLTYGQKNTIIIGQLKLKTHD